MSNLLDQLRDPNSIPSSPGVALETILIESADAELYRAKSEGRDRVLITSA